MSATKNKKKSVLVTLPPEVIEQLREFKARTGISYSHLIRLGIDLALEKYSVLMRTVNSETDVIKDDNAKFSAGISSGEDRELTESGDLHSEREGSATPRTPWPTWAAQLDAQRHRKTD